MDNSILKPGIPVALCSDHAGYPVKEAVKRWLEGQGIACKDFGTYNIAVCGSGEGINITLNKHQGIRSALCWRLAVARLARQHNDANVLAMPGRFVTDEEAIAMVEAFLTTAYEGGRHQRRVDKIPVK